MSFYTDYQHKIYFFILLLIKSLLLLPTMYIVHFKLSFNSTLTLIKHVKIPTFAAATL